MVTDAQKRAFKKYYAKNKESHRIVTLRFNKKSDADVLGRIDEQDNKTDYVRKLVRDDIKE